MLMTCGWLLEDAPAEPLPRLKAILVAERHHLDTALHGRKDARLILWLSAVLTDAEPAAALAVFAEIFTQIDPAWKLGRAVNLSFLKETASWPVTPAKITRWLITALLQVSNRMDSVKDRAAWLMTAWRLQHESGAPPAVQCTLLLDIASRLRLAAQPYEAVRIMALALHLLPERAPAALAQRCRVAAWTLAEAGLTAPASLRVVLDDLPFPGEPPTSEKGQEAARLFRDQADAFQTQLQVEIETDEDWQKLRAAGVVLHHPLAALAWIGKKAQSYALKKQHELLQAAARLAQRHHCLCSQGRILAEAPESAERVIAFAETLRQAQRRMPVLRDSAAWLSLTHSLRTAWGRLEPDAIRDEETLFMLHELLLDRETTLNRNLPAEMRVLALRHLFSRRQPSTLITAIQDEPRLMQSLEHQRTIELWSLAAEIRDRKELANTVWISLVMKGDLAGGRYSWIIQSSSERLVKQGRIRAAVANETSDMMPLLREIAAAAAELAREAEWILLTTESSLSELQWQQAITNFLPQAKVTQVPSWEWAFRVMREVERPKDIVFESLLPEAGIPCASMPTPPAASPLAQACLLLAGRDASDAETRWQLIGEASTPPETRRSLHLGRHPVLVSEGPLKLNGGALNLIRLSLSQATRLVLLPKRALSSEEITRFEQTLFAKESLASLPQRLKALGEMQPDLWQLHGVPW